MTQQTKENEQDIQEFRVELVIVDNVGLFLVGIGVSFFSSIVVTRGCRCKMDMLVCSVSILDWH